MRICSLGSLDLMPRAIWTTSITFRTLIVSTGAQVTKAVIKVAVAKINGTVEGDILASKELVLGRTANVRGHVTSAALIVEEGAQFNGNCRRLKG